MKNEKELGALGASGSFALVIPFLFLLSIANKIRGKEQMFLDRLRSLFPFYCCSHSKGDCFANQSDIRKQIVGYRTNK